MCLCPDLFELTKMLSEIGSPNSLITKARIPYIRYANVNAYFWYVVTFRCLSWKWHTWVHIHTKIATWSHWCECKLSGPFKKYKQQKAATYLVRIRSLNIWNPSLKPQKRAGHTRVTYMGSMARIKEFFASFFF